MGLTYLHHADIDPIKWDKCIEHAPNALPYALSWYLDVVAYQCWDALVLNDYEAVMPLPFNHKLVGYKQIYRPILCQQLGVFGSVTPELMLEFIHHIPASFRKIGYTMNYLNGHNDLQPKTNLILPLHQNYEQLMTGFSSSLRKNIRKADKLILETSSDVDGLILLYQKELESKVKFGSKNYKTARKLFNQILQHHTGSIYTIHDDQAIIARGMFLFFNKRIINLFSAADAHANKHAMTSLLSKVIERHAGEQMILDFEGSQISGIKAYFQSFGAIEQPYFQYNANTLPSWINAIINRCRASILSYSQNG